MLHLLHPLANHLRDQVPALRWIDLDQGQLTDSEEAETLDSVLAPAVLLALPAVPWESAQGGHQQGRATLIVSTVLLLPGPSHHTRDFPPPAAPLSPFLSDLATLTLGAAVHEAVQSWRASAQRTGTRCFYAGTFYVVEHTYTLPVAHQPTPPKVIALPSLHTTGEITQVVSLD